MKGMLIGALALVLAGGGTYAVIANQNDVKTDNIESVETTSGEGGGEVITERTVDLKGNEPWQWAAPSKLKEWQESGEIVYLWSDAEGVEDLIQSGMDAEPDAYTVKNDYTQLFVNEMRDRQPDQAEYLDTLSAAGESLAAGDLETAQTKLDEAKTLRTN